MGKMIYSFLKRNTTLSPMTKNRLRTSCASAVGRGDFKKLEPEEGRMKNNEVIHKSTLELTP